MKKLLFLVLLVLPSFALSQNLLRTLKYETAYAITQLDTITLGGMHQYTNIYVNLSATDSISMVVKIAGTDLTSYATAVTVDSLVTTTSGMKSINITTAMAGYERALLILDCNHFQAAQSANSGATYSATLVGKK